MEKVEETPGKTGPRRRIYLLLVIVIVAILLVAIGVIYPYLTPHNKGFTPPSSIVWGNFTKVSNSYFGSNETIYFVSWYGCPIGAADSWAFYAYLSSLGNITKYVQPHYSNPNDSYPNTPGLIFNGSFSVRGTGFHPYYVYNQSLNATTNGTPVDPSNALSLGLKELQAKLPASIYSIEFSIMENISTTGISTSQSPTPSGQYFQHINTNVIITGKGGAWVLNGPLFDPSVLSGMNATVLLSNPISVSDIKSGNETVGAILRQDSSIVNC